MEKFHIEGSKSTPEIHFDPDELTFSIKGESYPENSFEFYKPVYAKLQQILNELSNIKIVLDVSYLNTSSTKAIVNILDLLSEKWALGKKVEIVWYYESDNEHAIELAEDFQELTDIPIKLEPIDE